MNQSQPPPFFWWSAVAAINHQFSQRGAGRTCPDKPHHLSVINTCTTCYPSPFYCIHRCVQSSKFPLFKSSFSYCFQFKLLVCDSTYLPSLYNLCKGRVHKKNPEKMWSFAKLGGGGVSDGSKMPNLYFGKVFFQLACRIILGPPKHVLHLV